MKRLQAVAWAIAGEGKVQVIVRLCQLVKLFRNGEPVRMSKRAGEFVTLRDVVDEVGPDVVRFMMLYRKNEAPLDFDFAKVTEQSKDNLCSMSNMLMRAFLPCCAMPNLRASHPPVPRRQNLIC